jgi:hypothetical protein
MTRRPGDTGRRAVVPALVGLCAVAAFSWWRGRQTAALVAVSVAALLLLLSFVWPPAIRALTATVERLAHWFGVGLSFVVLGAVWVVAIVPVSLLNRLVGIDLLDRGRGPGWAASEDRASPGRVYARETGPSGRLGRRAVRTAAVLLPLVAFGVTVVHRAETVPPPPLTPFGVRSTTDPPGQVFDDEWASYQGRTVSQHLFPGEPWGAAVLRAQDEAPCGAPDERYVGRNFDWSSRYLNVVDENRVTLAVPDPAYTVWMFGGSTTYGVGQRDEHTIPSEIVRLAAQDGLRLDVVNFGVCSQVNWMETQRFQDMLGAGVPPPDLAVFLDGLNDWGGGFEREVYGLLDPSVPYSGFRTLDEQQELVDDARARGYEESHDQARQVALVAHQYAAGVELARAVGDEFGVPVVHFWQPGLITMPPSAPGNPTVLHNLELDAASLVEVGEFYDQVQDRSGVDPIDLTDIFDDATQPIFFDYGHTNEAGARIEATAMYPFVERALTG